MKIKKTLKKIAALGAGVTMLGATFMGAMAADLSNYPAPFVSDGKFNAILVIGDTAKTSDVIGSIDVATSLQYAAKVKKSVSTGTSATVTVTGDAKKLQQSTNKLELNETVNSVYPTLTSADLAALKDGSITNNWGTFKYTQTLSTPPAKVIFKKDSNHEKEDIPTEYLKFNGSQIVYNYKISFSPAAKATVTGTTISDLENKKITMLGKEYTILTARHAGQNQTKLTLMAGALTNILSRDEEKTYQLNGKDYAIKLIYVSSTGTECKFVVNDQPTDTMNAGDTFTLSDGTEMGVKSIMAQKTGEPDSVEFTLGAQRVVLEDTNTINSSAGGTVTIGSTELSTLSLAITTSSDTAIATTASTENGQVKISSIEIWYTPTQDFYVAKDEKASEQADIAEGEEGNFFLDGFDFEFKGLEWPKFETISVTASGNENYRLKFTNKAAQEYNAEVWCLNSSTEVNVGTYTGSTHRKLHYVENETIDDEELFIVTRNDYSHIMQLRSISTGSSTADNEGTVKIKDLGDGSLYEVTYSGKTGNLIMDGNTYKVNVTADSTSASIYVDMDGSGAIGSTVVSNLTSQYGAQINLVDRGNPQFVRVQTEEDEGNARQEFLFRFMPTSDSKIDINSSSLSGPFSDGSMHRAGDTYVYQGYVIPFGMFVERDAGSSTTTDQDKITLKYPDSEVTAAVFATAGVTTSTTDSGGEGVVTYYETQQIEVGAAKLASEVADIKAQNAIVVGGPCVSKAAATLMGDPADCTEGFEDGKAMLKLFENNGKVALLVAGYSAMDTRRACRVLADYSKYTLSGMEMEVAGTSLTDITVSAPTVKEETTTEESTE
ncbi:hypothetical protein COT48_02275 [Candidatus Woesearchaeota archaeon CG08_land_8_20_14_0_20_47_9]|nr:MAG: hypothetical protein AUJ69_02895 [Candidatus Woesearchaeota archaeon CG1_02_47_18]PIO04073.1 MAG: hypothetical protein COT48_02275 [Candidatus Woesearchaeota archaeon CG08_land_8_20_14_0_20_47_9]HII30187.1 hypothetical protein [Candidatus Woesearchaeota archaeon]